MTPEEKPPELSRQQKAAITKKLTKRLTRRSRLILEWLAEHPGANYADAGIALGIGGGDRGKASCRVSQAMQGKSAQAKMAEMMELDPRLNDEALREKLAEGLSATRTERGYHRGEVISEAEDADFATRRSYLELAGKWKGIVEKHEVTGKDGAPISLKALILTDDGASKE